MLPVRIGCEYFVHCCIAYPRVKFQSTDVSVSEGTELLIRCHIEVNTAPNNITIEWYKSGTALDAANDLGITLNRGRSLFVVCGYFWECL